MATCAGAGIDVFSAEPCTDSPLFELPQVVVTPHLGASTEEAQDRAGTDVAASVRLALAGEFVPDAVNVGGGVVGEEVGSVAGSGAQARSARRGAVRRTAHDAVGPGARRARLRRGWGAATLGASRLVLRGDPGARSRSSTHPRWQPSVESRPRISTAVGEPEPSQRRRRARGGRRRVGP